VVATNLDVVRSICAAWERGDFSASDWADQDIEFALVGGPNPGRSRGLAGMARLWAGVLNVFERASPTVDEYQELDDERILVLYRTQGVGKVSGIEVSRLGATQASLFHLRDQKVTKLTIWWGRERALADLGLGPERDAADP
jgi:hypothetical protein